MKDGNFQLENLHPKEYKRKKHKHNLMYKYAATVIKVIDGDTVDLNLDLGFKIKFQLRGRLTGINAPEGKQTDAANWLHEQLPIGKTIIVETKKTQEKYGRWLVTIFLDDKNLNLELLEKGLADPYKNTI